MAVVEAQALAGAQLAGYIDPNPCDWLDGPRMDDAALEPGQAVVLGIGGIDPDQLARRLDLLGRYRGAGMAAPAVVHPAAWVSADARLEAGAIVLARAVVQPAAVIGCGAIVNTGAIVEHDSSIGDGSHVAPGAVVLGDCTVGAGCMIGAGAVVLPAATVPAATLVKAITRYPQ
jgi:acyl-[acyl carrier protein]--UDP-N-acetylglucosamine O-acyltransferase